MAFFLAVLKSLKNSNDEKVITITIPHQTLTRMEAFREVNDRISRSIGSVMVEKARFLWDNFLIWYRTKWPWELLGDASIKI